MLVSETPGIIIDVRWYVFLIMYKVCIRKKFVFIFIVYDLIMRKETTVMVNFVWQLG